MFHWCLGFQLLSSLFWLNALRPAPVSAACEAPWFQINDDCYYFSPNANSVEELSWHQAENWCLQNGAHLTTVESLDVRQQITNETQQGIYNGAMWIGLSRFEDRINYKWVDGSPTNFTDWAPNQPNNNSLGLCVLQDTHSDTVCVTCETGINIMSNILDSPEDASPPDTFFFWETIVWDDPPELERCQKSCIDEPACTFYTFVSFRSPIFNWWGTCTGASDKYNVSGAEDEFAYSGRKYDCQTNGLWYEGNCGEKRGFICKKANNPGISNSTTLPTPTVPGFCPSGFFDGGGNKCFKIVVASAEVGFTWDQSLELCRAEPGVAPDLASILSEYENAAITMHIRDHYWGFWIGLKQSDSFSEQWLWSDNQDPVYYNWANGKPAGTDQCGELWTNPGPIGSWNNLDCIDQRGYICETYKDANAIISTPASTLAHSCKADYFNYGGICYRKFTTPANWSSALAACEADGATLATIHSEAENAALYVFGGDIAPFWIGYHKNANDEWVWTDGWPDIYSNWNAGEDPGTGGGCASFKDNGKWKDDDCPNTLNAVCMISSATIPTTPAYVEGKCPDGWVEYGGSCFYFNPNSGYLDWTAAEAECNVKAAPYSVGTLASIHSAVDNEFIYQQMKKNGVSTAWIGLYEVEPGSLHTWSDGSPYQYSNWAPGEPNDDETHYQQCVEMHIDLWPGMWNDHLCNTYLSYVCKAPKFQNECICTSQMVVQPPTPSSPPGLKCPEGCDTWRASGAYCYYMEMEKPLTFNEAQEACVRLAGREANLVTVPDMYTNYFLLDWVIKESTTKVNIWLGFTRPNEDVEFRWIDSTPLNYSNWLKGQPDNAGGEYCAEMSGDNGLWSDRTCEQKNPYVCQIKMEYVPQPPTPQTNSGYYVTSGEMAGIVIGTILGTIVLMCVVLFAYSSIRGGFPFSSSKKSDLAETASTYDLPYNNFEEQPSYSVSRSSSMKSTSNRNEHEA